MKQLSLFLLALLTYTLSTAQSDLPAVKIKQLSGAEVLFSALASSSDTALIVSFWATWCVPCKEEMPSIDKLVDVMGKDKVKIFAIDLEKINKKKTDKFFTDLKIKLISSIVAISGIHLLKIFMNLDKYSKDTIILYVVVHLTFVVSGVLLAMMDYIMNRSVNKHAKLKK